MLRCVRYVLLLTMCSHVVHIEVGPNCRRCPRFDRCAECDGGYHEEADGTCTLTPTSAPTPRPPTPFPTVGLTPLIGLIFFRSLDRPHLIQRQSRHQSQLPSQLPSPRRIQLQIHLQSRLQSRLPTPHRFRASFLVSKIIFCKFDFFLVFCLLCSATDGLAPSIPIYSHQSSVSAH